MQKDLSDIKIGLVLAGGGAKGAYEVGVYNALKELDIVSNIKVISGTSIGAINALLFAMDDSKRIKGSWSSLNYSVFLLRQEEAKENKLPKVLDLIKKLDIDSNILNQIKLSDIGLLSQKGIKNLIEEYVDMNLINECGKEIYATAYNIDEERPEYFRLNSCDEEELKLRLLASCSVPHLFKPIIIDGVRYADGGIHSPLYSKVNVDNIPIHPLKYYDLDLIIVVYLSYKDKVNKVGFQNKIIEIYPSVPLEIMSGIGALRINKGIIERNIELGYRDAMVLLAPIVLNLLKGKEIEDLINKSDD